MFAAFELWFLSCTLLVFFHFLGFGITRLFSRSADASDPRNPIIGVATISVVGWYSLKIADLGVSVPFRALAVVAVGGLIGHLVSEWPTSWRHFGLLAKGFAPDQISIVLFGILWWPLLVKEGLTIAGTNGDVANYAEIAQHILGNGFDSPGHIVGANLGSQSAQDVTGAYAFLAAGLAVLGVEVNRVLLPILASAVAMMAHFTWCVIAEVVPRVTFRWIALAVFPQVTYMFAYLNGNYFLAQILGMASTAGVFLCAINLRNEIVQTSSMPFMPGASLVACQITLLMVYPQMAFVVIPLVVITVMPSAPFRKKFLGRIGLCFVLSVMTVPERFLLAARRAVNLAQDSTNGWPLPNLNPADVLGLTSSELSKFDAFAMLTTVFFVLSFFAALVSHFRSGESLMPENRSMLARIFGALLLSWLYVAWSSPDSYRQWKWITFFSPMLLTAWALVIFTSLRFRNGRVMIAIFLAWVVVSVGVKSQKYIEAVALTTPVVGPDLVDLRNDPYILSERTINLKTGPHLESMWPAVFIQNSELVFLDETYYPVTEPRPGPTLVRTDFLISPERVVPLNSSFSLVPFPSSPVLDSIEGFAAETLVDQVVLFAESSGRVRLDVTVKNAGSRTWLGSGAGAAPVTLGIRRLDPELGRTIEEAGLPRWSLAQFPDFVLPDESRAVSVEFDAPFEPGSYVFEIGPVVEGIAWAADVSEEWTSVVTVYVTADD